MSAVNRQPAIARQHPAEKLPERPERQATAPPPADVSDSVEKLTAQHNVRIRPSTKEDLARLVDRLRYETGDRSISIASLTDQAIRDYLKQYR